VRRAFVVAVAVLAPLACVDLFHSTDFADNTAKTDAATQDAATDVEAGPSGPKPLVDFCAWTPEEARAHATRACAWLGACEGPVGESVFGQCMLHALWAYDCSFNPTMRPLGRTRAMWSCLSDTKSCAEVDACVFPDAPSKCNAVASGSFTACGGDLLLECGRREEGRATAVDPCPLVGRACTTKDPSTALCSGVKKDCSLGIECSGTAAVDCRNENALLVDHGVDCAAFGAGSCAGDDAGVGCVPSEDAGACDDAGTIALACTDAGVVTSCVGGRALAIDCTKLGLPCDVTTKAIAPYEPLAACAERLDAGRCASADDCTGTTLHSCAQGASFTVDCASVGLGTCEKVSTGALARCTSP